MVASRPVPSGRRIDTAGLHAARRTCSTATAAAPGPARRAALYPHQWLWDSCFIAIGLARVDPARAAGEVRALFRGQWANGMLPHMLFAESVPRHRQPPDLAVAPATRSRPRRRDVVRDPAAARAIAAWRVAQALPTRRTDDVSAPSLPKLVAYHQWLYDERDPDQCGLITLIHPWECGLDTTPPWMQALAGCRRRGGRARRSASTCARVVRFVRQRHAVHPAVERPTDDEGLRMLVLATLAKRTGSSCAGCRDRGSVLIEDLAFNAILAAANRSLALVAAELDEALPPSSPADRAHRRRSSSSGTTRPASTSRATRSRASPCAVSTIATFLPLFAASRRRARAPPRRVPPRRERLLAVASGADRPDRCAGVP